MEGPLGRWALYAALLLSWFGAVGSPASAQNVSEDLTAIRDFYAAIESVHLKARAEISRTLASSSTRTETRSGIGTIEYWEKGDLFRRDTRTSPELGLIDDMDVAYDGSVVQVMRYLMVAPESPERRLYLLLSSGRQPVPSTVPNPLFLPVYFVKISTDSCPECQPSLAELRDPLVWAESQRSSDIDGDALVSIEMTSERSFSAQGRYWSFPTRFRVQSEPGQGGDGMTFDIVIEELEINGHIDPRVFALDRAAADMIYDEDTQTFIKAMRSRAEP